MTAAALKPDLFNHLFATNPAGPDEETLTATLVSVVLHASIAAAVIWAGYSVSTDPATTPRDEPPSIIFPTNAPPAYASAVAPPSRGDTDLAPQPAPIPLPGPPVVGIPPATPDLRTDFGVPGTGTNPVPGNPAQHASGGSGNREMGAFSVVEVMPALLNAAEVKRALQRSYPPMLRDAGIGGRTALLLLIDEQGRVVEAKIRESSGQAALDRVALEVAPLMRFSPAMNRDQRVRVWAQVPLDFRTD